MFDRSDTLSTSARPIDEYCLTDRKEISTALPLSLAMTILPLISESNKRFVSYQTVNK